MIDMLVVPSIDVGKLEHSNDCPVFFCKKDFGSSRIINKQIEKISELRRINNFILKESAKLKPKEYANLNSYRQVL